MCSDYYSRKICWKNQKFLTSIHKLLLYRISRACGHQPVLTSPVQVSNLPCPEQRVFLEICPVSCPEQGRTQDRAGSALPCGHIWYTLCSLNFEMIQEINVNCFYLNRKIIWMNIWLILLYKEHLIICLKQHDTFKLYRCKKIVLFYSTIG